MPRNEKSAKANRLALRPAFCYIQRPENVGQVFNLPLKAGQTTAMLPTRRERFLRSLALLTATPLVWLTGCADGPVPEMRAFNPWVRKQWNEDEQRVATFHRKIADLAALRSRATQMPPAERDETAAQLAARLNEESSPALRAELVRTLGAIATPIAQEAVVATLSDEAVSVRVIACQALGHQPTPVGFQALAHAVTSDSDLDVRIVAARELGKFRGFAAPQALRPALDDRDPALQLAAMQSLEVLDGHREFRRNVAVWREHLDGGSPTPPPAPSVAEVVRQYWSWF